MEIKGAIFDMDGTLLDSMYLWDRLGGDYLRSRGIEPRQGLDEDIKAMSLLQAVEFCRQEYGLTDRVEDVMADIYRLVERFYRESVQPKPGVREFLKLLQSRGVSMCVATATDRYLAEAALERCGLLEYFSQVWSCREVGAGKHFPHIYEKALSHLGTPKSATPVFEDALYAIMTAKEAGFFVVGVYDKSEQAHEAEIRALADLYLYTLDEMQKYLK